ncbi:MAG: MurR/RpiR family transcriptional regulator [Erysipelotrichaceae bacterium]|nr:MurR/RpiR family transcriptional regulator [Erysipelotrichaceae bacterium]
MLLIHKIENTHFSSSESAIIDYILKKGVKIKNMTTTEIAAETYTSASLLIRVAKKLGYSGWNEFKEAYLDELQYLYANNQVDACIPFVVSDDMMKIVQNISSLEKETIDDTVSLLKHDDLSLALKYLRNADEIDIYVSQQYAPLTHIFKENMMLINHYVNIYDLSSDSYIHATMSSNKKCAIIISYAGKRKTMSNICLKLKEKQTPIIAITSIAENDLSTLSDVTLLVSSRELIHAKIGNFATVQSIKYILDVLYANIFAMNYTDNLDYRMNIGKEVEYMY